MEALYKSMPLYSEQKELRLLTINPTESTSQQINCSLGTYSLADTTLPYRNFVSAGTASDLTPSALLATWIEASQPRREINSAKQTLTFPRDTVSHRFRWGDYAALSYCWGNPNDTTAILVNGVETQVTKTLAEALRCLARTCQFYERFKLWVDALCIDQANYVERGEQVSVMRSFYSSAWSILGFLGPEANASGKALRLLVTLATIYDNKEECVRVRENLMQGIHNHEPGSWLALNRLMLRPYWERLWILQELVMGGFRTVLLCGSEDIPWQVFCRGISVIHFELWVARHEGIQADIQQSIIDPSDETYDFDATPQLDHVFKDSWVLTEIQESRSKEPASFSRLLEVVNVCKCVDARDKVYGVLGIMDPKLSANIVPDYTADLATIMITTAMAYISTYGNLALLRDANMWGAAGAPSWVPDWTWGGRSRDCRPDDGLTPENSDVSMERRPYCADRGIIFTMPVYRGRYLDCQAVIFDYVDGLGANPAAGITAIVQSTGVKKSVYGDSNNEISWHLGVALYAGRRRRVTHSSALLHLPRTMDEAKEHFTRLGWQHFIQDLYHYRRWVSWSESNASLVIGGRELREHCSSTKMQEDGADEQDYWTAHHAWVRTALAGMRRLVTTTGGRFGWAPCARGVPPGDGIEVQRGDTFAIFPGCSTPILLRPTEDVSVYRVIGEAYVHGLMDGEIMTLLEKEECEIRNIRLC